ncbi:DNA-directed RNA polymerase II subunit one [Pisolithus orientalis]|uniref:DNA-directed RNA polymerase II subunit one n=1 Tax=Pisolithus orientalis TaxID=936130 RepID=UPI002225561F|nr:DNA-directed RNA polymerase II subunit one [Pisolithus orientalis]KAI6032600.1 DNA-directed RNA polymerase II subunit one [Pisolithus orientalis]
MSLDCIQRHFGHIELARPVSVFHPGSDPSFTHKIRRIRERKPEMAADSDEPKKSHGSCERLELLIRYKQPKDDDEARRHRFAARPSEVYTISKKMSDSDIHFVSQTSIQGAEWIIIPILLVTLPPVCSSTAVDSDVMSEEGPVYKLSDVEGAPAHIIRNLIS